MKAIPELHYHVGKSFIPDIPVWDRDNAEEWAKQDKTTVVECSNAECIDIEEQRAWHSGHHEDCAICQHYQEQPEWTPS